VHDLRHVYWNPIVCRVLYSTLHSSKQTSLEDRGYLIDRLLSKRFCFILWSG
jgi:hypothetical protein